MTKKIGLIFLIILVLLSACTSPTPAPTEMVMDHQHTVEPTMDHQHAAEPTAEAAHSHDMSELQIVASTSWVGAFAKAAGAENITVIAPSNIQHPPDYDPKPSDLAAVSEADYILMAGFEGFAKRLQEAVGADSSKLITVMTENSPEAIHKEVTRLGELFGTQEKAAEYLAMFDTEYAAFANDVKAVLGDKKPVVVAQAFVAPWVMFAGLEVAGVYGPMPVSPDELKNLSDLKPTLVFENIHMGGGQPIVEATGAVKIDLVNFPGDDLDLLEIFHTNTHTLEHAFEDLPSSSASHYPVTIENCGRTLTIIKAPERVVTTWQAPVELLVKLGLGDKIVGTEYGQQFAPAAEIAEAFNKVPVLSAEGASKEAWFAAKPDFVLSSFLAWDFDTANGRPGLDELEKAGAQVFGLSDNCTAESRVTYTDMFDDILKIGQIFDAEDSAQALVDDMKARIATVQSKVTGLTPTKAFFDAGGEGPVGTAGAGLQNEMIMLAGGENIFADHPNYYEEVSLEEVAARMPEIFVVDTWSDLSYINTRTEWLFSTFPNTPAGQQKRFVETPGIYIYYASIRFADGIEIMAKAFHPEAFK